MLPENRKKKEKKVKYHIDYFAIESPLSNESFLSLII